MIESAFLAADFPAISGVLPLPRLRVSAPGNTTFLYCSCLYNGKFTDIIFILLKIAFHARCLNCLGSFTRADSTPQMADFGLREKC
jgi:hypothetical protein